MATEAAGPLRIVLSPEQNAEGMRLLRAQKLAQEAFQEWVLDQVKKDGGLQNGAAGVNYDPVLSRMTLTPQGAG